MTQRRAVGLEARTMRAKHVAWRLPLANAHVPVMRQPPSTRIAFAPGPMPQANTSRSPPNTSRATRGSRYPADIEQPEPWFMHQATEASPLAIASTHWM
jgi:hypothetical protein